ncbi:hypothetical protein [Kingella negevensis]|uniref:hypothetical protein n=1 Tax=Kingella negevensis TaxID=1522312 RepID=UPI0006933FD5|nr:hypothetical protein [Kingella negevensis]MDK4689558.1 hypothetical protein [Kingella negevensis]WII90405.1 hypothetical protein QEO93_08025 [Kingella negevensis]
MKFRLILSTIISSFALSAQAASVCNLQNNTCLSTSTASEPQSVPQAIDNEIKQVWHTSNPEELNDIVIKQPEIKVEPKPKEEKKTEVADKTKKTDVKQTVRNDKKVQTAKVIAVPPPQKAPVLTRRQVLEKEINREKVGLKSAQSQLASAKKKGNQSAANRFAALVIDRQQNIAALEAEMRR